MDYKMRQINLSVWFLMFLTGVFVGCFLEACFGHFRNEGLLELSALIALAVAFLFVSLIERYRHLEEKRKEEAELRQEISGDARPEIGLAAIWGDDFQLPEIQKKGKNKRK